MEFIDPEDSAAQFRADMKMQTDLLSVGVMVNSEMQLASLAQGTGHRIVFADPEMMREVGKHLIEFADAWESGAAPGLEKPK
jgi:hypothetical protein